MDEILLIVKVAINAVVILFIDFCFLEKLYDRKYSGKWMYIAAYIGSVLISGGITLLGIPTLNMIKSILVINILWLVLYKGSTKWSVVFNTIFALSAIFADIITVLIVSAFGSSTVLEILDNFQAMIATGVLYWIGVFLMYKLCIYFFKRRTQDSLSTKQIVYLCFITLFEMTMVSYTSVLIKDSTQGAFLIFILFGFLLLNLYSTHLIEQVSENSRLKSELALANQQASIQLKYYSELMHQNEVSRKVIHDIRNHVQTIASLYAVGNIEKAEGYNETLDKEMSRLSFGFECEHPILSVIIGHQLQQAEIKGIRLNVKIEDMPMGFISDLDMTTIFANLLENAMDACEGLEDENRKVDLKVWRFNCMMVIRICNPTKEEPVKKGEFFTSTKVGHEGIGLTNVKNAIDKYEGLWNIEVADNNFEVMIIISIPEEYCKNF